MPRYTVIRPERESGEDGADVGGLDVWLQLVACPAPALEPSHMSVEPGVTPHFNSDSGVMALN